MFDYKKKESAIIEYEQRFIALQNEIKRIENEK